MSCEKCFSHILALLHMVVTLWTCSFIIICDTYRKKNAKETLFFVFPFFWGKNQHNKAIKKKKEGPRQTNIKNTSCIVPVLVLFSSTLAKLETYSHKYLLQFLLFFPSLCILSVICKYWIVTKTHVT